MRVIIVAVLTVVMAPAALGAINTFTSRPTFNAAAPALVTEDFEDIDNIPAFAFIGLTGPIDATSSHLVFLAPGDILPRLSISDVPIGPPLDMFATGAGLFPGSTRTVGTTVDTDHLQIEFAAGVTSVGLDLYSATSGANLVAESLTIELFNTSNVSLGTFNATTVLTGSVFFGAISNTDLIVRVTILSELSPGSPNARAELVDNISFDAVPEPSALVAWSLLGAVAVGAIRLRR
jgi:hypothetical protein